MGSRMLGLLVRTACVVLSLACVAVDDAAGASEEEPLQPFKRPPAHAWTGKELLLWDGEDGYALDPAENTWRTMARHPAATVLPSPPKLKWLNDGKALAAYWGPGPECALYLDSYLPETDSWRRVAAVPAKKLKGSGDPGRVSAIVVVDQKPIVFFWPRLLADAPESTAVGVRLDDAGALRFVLGGDQRGVPHDGVYAYRGKVWCPAGFSWRLWDARSETWEDLAAVQRPFSVRWVFNHCSTGKDIYIFGGDGGFAVPVYLGDLLVYAFESNEVRELSRAGGPTPRLGAAMCWTGREVVIWGGLHRIPTEGEIDARTGTYQRDGGVTNTGGAFDPATAEWTPLPTETAPSPRFGAACVWTGKEVLIWGGFDQKEGRNVQIYDGAAYDPEKRTWRELPSLVEYVRKLNDERRNWGHPNPIKPPTKEQFSDLSLEQLVPFAIG
ncbi:MAG TPA: kelch repeat-containing protein, partial [Thermoleophilia bacterium]|nr:kelch repeat-containing protein [Thermoleophilia bacterium]